GRDLDLGGTFHRDLILLDMAAAEHRRQVNQAAQLRDVAGRDHVEQAVVELCVGREVHAAAVGPIVGGGDREAGEAFAPSVERHLEVCRLPSCQAAESGI